LGTRATKGGGAGLVGLGTSVTGGFGVLGSGATCDFGAGLLSFGTGIFGSFGTRLVGLGAP
jgi:hypothetical protein